MVQTRTCMLLYVTITSPTQFLISSLKRKWTPQKIPCERGTIYRSAQTEGFSGLRHLSDSQIISLQIPIALYQRRGNGWSYRRACNIKETIQPNPASFLYKYWTAKGLLPKQHLMVLLWLIGPWSFWVENSAISKKLEYT